MLPGAPARTQDYRPEGAGMAEANPTVRQRELAMRLRQLRNGLGLTVDHVAEQLLCSATKISRIETATRPASLRDIRDLCRLYGVGDDAAAELMNLARQAREPGWWTQYDDLALGPYPGLEQEATALTHFSMYFVNGLMQTEDYARAIIKAVNPKINPKVLDDRVEARLRRQIVLAQEDRPRLRSLLDEGVLLRPVGGPEVMGAQLDKILQVVDEEKATVQVIRFSSGAHASVDGDFTFLEFAGSSLPDIVSVEGLLSTLYQERPEELARYREALEYLRDAALSPRDSLSLIAEIKAGYAG
jgi:transcriptional regulator with XRE-family HTH domain